MYQMFIMVATAAVILVLASLILGLMIVGIKAILQMYNPSKKAPSIRYRRYAFLGGPYDGEIGTFADDLDRTATFTANRHTGYYIRTKDGKRMAWMAESDAKTNLTPNPFDQELFVK